MHEVSGLEWQVGPAIRPEKEKTNLTHNFAIIEHEESKGRRNCKLV